MPPALFEHVVRIAEDKLGCEHGLLEVLRNVDKIGIYMMISPQGFVYGTTETALMQAGHHHYIGSILSDHLEDLARSIPFSPSRPDRRTPADIQLQGTGLTHFSVRIWLSGCRTGGVRPKERPGSAVRRFPVRYRRSGRWYPG